MKRIARISEWSAAEIACKEREDLDLGHDGGYMIPIHSNIGQGMGIHFETLVNWYGKNELILVSRKQHFQLLHESGREINRDQQCERC